MQPLCVAQLFMFIHFQKPHLRHIIASPVCEETRTEWTARIACRQQPPVARQQALDVQASSQAGDRMSVMGRPAPQPPNQSPFPHGTTPSASHYSLHQQAQPSGPSAAVGTSYHPNPSYLAQTQVRSGCCCAANQSTYKQCPPVLCKAVRSSHGNTLSITFATG